MCTEVKQVQQVADTFIKQDLQVIESTMTHAEKIKFINSLATLNVLGEHLTKSLVRRLGHHF